MQDVPTADEAGLPGLEVGIWHGLYAPKGTPAEIIERLSKSLQVALKDPNVVARFAELGTAPSSDADATPAALKAKLESEIDRWKPIIDAAGQLRTGSDCPWTATRRYLARDRSPLCGMAKMVKHYLEAARERHCIRPIVSPSSCAADLRSPPQSFFDIGHGVAHGAGLFSAGARDRPVVLGLVILFQALRRSQGEPMGPFAWRGMLSILPAPVFFGLTVRGLGFVPAMFLTALIAAFAIAGDEAWPWRWCCQPRSRSFPSRVFSYALGLPFQRFGPWLRF